MVVNTALPSRYHAHFISALFSFLRARHHDAVPGGGGGQRPVQIHIAAAADGVRNLACRILRKRDCLVFPARIVAEAEALWQQERGLFDVILSDVVLPDGNGLDFVERCAAGGTQPLIILSSGYASGAGEDIQGLSGFLPRPFTWTLFSDTLRKALG